MSEKLFILPSTKGVVVIETTHTHHTTPTVLPAPVAASSRRVVTRKTAVNAIFVVLGLVMVVLGLADVSSRLVGNSTGSSALERAFTPLGLLPLGASHSATTTATTTNSTTPALTIAPASAPIVPKRIQIPSIGVNATVEAVGVKSDGAMANPSNFSRVGWYKGGAQVGAPGRAVLGGHVNNALTRGGVFQYLDRLKSGDQIVLTDAEGKGYAYRVDKLEVYDKDHAPTQDIFTTQGDSGIALVTCDGSWDSSSRSYTDRLVVYASLVQ